MKFNKVKLVVATALAVTLFTGVSTSVNANISFCGSLSHSNPVLGNPRATHNSRTCRTGTTTPVNVTQIRAKVDANNNGTSTTTTGFRTLSSTSHASSGQLIASTSRVTFTGTGGYRTSTNGTWVTSTATASY